ncbi:unnamed protein product, partial [Urochloa humidicola]
VALLSQRTGLDVPTVYSKDVFWWFTSFIKKQELGWDKKLIDEWNDQFMEEIVDTDTLHDLIMLAWKTGQTKLLDVCSKRVADILKVRLSGAVAKLLNLPSVGDGESDDEEDGDDEDGDEDGGDDDNNDPQPEVPGSRNDDMDCDIPPEVPDDSDSKGAEEDLSSEVSGEHDKESVLS